MSERWAMSVDSARAAEVAALRLLPGIEVCADGVMLWLRGDALADVETRLRAIAGANRYTILADGQLVPSGARVPRGRLPAGPWTRLRDAAPVGLPAMPWPGRVEGRVALRLVASDEFREPSLLECSLDDWLAYAEMAPQVRLAPLTFAVSNGRRALVRGTPLPPLRGQLFVEQSDVAVPAGWRWEPAIDAATVRAALLSDDVAAEREGGLIVFVDRDARWQLVPAGAFVRATRSAVRMTAEEAR